ncbi:hypothetical protein AB4084_21625 [Lysobacter sp. 2RAB21]
MKRKKPVAANETTLRHLWLAGLGLAVIARREALAGAGRAAGRVEALQQRVRDLASGSYTHLSLPTLGPV